MRLLLATDEYLPHPGGAARVILETSRRLLERGHAVTVMTLERDPGLSRRDEIAGVPLRRIPLRGRLSAYPRALLASRRALRDQVGEYPLELLHIHLPLIGLGMVLGNTARSIPRVYTFHGPWYEEMKVELRAKPLPAVLRALYGAYVSLLCRGLRGWQGQVMRRCDRVTVLSEHFRQRIVASFPAVAGRTVLIPGGVDIGRFQPAADRRSARARLGLPAEGTILLTVRRLVPRMGLENLLQAFAQVSTGRDDLTLVVGGRGRLEGALRETAGRLGLAGRVRLTGLIPEEDLPAYYQAADLFLLPTQALEGFGLSTLEALASGLPVVGTPAGSTPEILGPLDARLLTAGTDVAALAAGIRQGLAIVRQEGPALAARCRAFAVEHYDWERIVDRYEALYAEALERGHGRE